MKIVNKTKKLSELENGECYIFHGKIFMKIDMECTEEALCYVVDPSNGHCITVSTSSLVKTIDPNLSY